jgi:hypothetical protein
MDLTWASVLLVAPELSEVSAELRVEILAAAAALSSDHFGALYTLAQIYYSAHYGALALAGATGPSAAVAASSAGGLSVQYATSVTNAHDFGSTAYGRIYRSFLSQAPGRVTAMVLNE